MPLNRKVFGILFFPFVAFILKQKCYKYTAQKAIHYVTGSQNQSEQNDGTESQQTCWDGVQ